ncbi:MAG: Calx-beta domain-containing protein, partial [Planctomycetota bacterium]
MHSINARPPAALSIVTLRIALLVTLAAGLHGLACTPASSGNNANNNANNNSPITGTVFFQVAASATSDEASGNFAITIELDCSGPITSDLTVEVFDTATGTASSGVDYVAFSTTVVTFLASSVDGATQTVNVNVMSDGDVEPDETVVLGLQNVTNGTIGATSTHTMTITNDDLAPAQVLYVADQDVAGEFELFLTTVASDGTIGTPVQLNGALVAGGDVRSQNISFGFSPDGKFVFYIADQNEDDVDELFLVDISGVPGAPVRVSADLTGTGKDVGRAFFSPDSTHLIYLADQDTDDTFELYKVSLASPAAGTRISRALSAGEQIPANGLRFSGNGLKATYMVTNGGGQFREVRVHTLADGTDVQANDALVGANINSNGGFFNAAGTKLIWWGEGEQAGVQELFIVDIVGVPSQARVHPSVVAAGGNIVFALLS